MVLNGDDVVREGEGGIARCEECLWIVVGRSCFSSEVLDLTVAAGMGCVSLGVSRGQSL